MWLKEMANNQTIHRARLLLWLAEDDEPALRANLGNVILDNGLIPTNPYPMGENDEGVIVSVMV